MWARLVLLLIQRPDDPGDNAFELRGQEVVIGRDNQCAVVLKDPSVSRRHCRLFPSPSGGSWSIEDLASTNGTFVNGKCVASGPIRLALGDEVRCGEKSSERLVLSKPVECPTRARHDAHVPFVAATPTYPSENRPLPWIMLALLSAMLKEETARRSDAEHQIVALQAEVRRLRELERLLATAVAGRSQAERRCSEVLHAMDRLGQKLRTRELQLEEEQRASQLLVRLLEHHKMERSATE